MFTSDEEKSRPWNVFLTRISPQHPQCFSDFHSRRFPSIRWRGTKSQLDKTEENVYKINELVEKHPMEKAPSSLAIMGRYVLTQDIFDKIDETEREWAVRFS